MALSTAAADAGRFDLRPMPGRMRLRNNGRPAKLPIGSARRKPVEPEINQATLDAVATYLSEHTGEHYHPHVIIGVGTVDYLLHSFKLTQ
jgi:hypothetical protein